MGVFFDSACLLRVSAKRNATRKEILDGSYWKMAPSKRGVGSRGGEFPVRSCTHTQGTTSESQGGIKKKKYSFRRGEGSCVSM